jgi:hypothetical protein
MVNRKLNILKRSLGMLLPLLFLSHNGSASQRYEVSGVLLQVDKERGTMSVSCREIPGYVDAMVMPFHGAIRRCSSRG